MRDLSTYRQPTAVAARRPVPLAGGRGGAHPAIPFTRAAVVSPFVRFLDAHGAPTDRLLEASGLMRSMLQEEEALVPLLPTQRFIDEAARRERIDDLGLQVGLRTSAFGFGSYGRHLGAAITVYDYLRTGIRLIQTLTSGERFWITSDSDRLRVHHRVPGEGRPGYEHVDLFGMAVTVRMLQAFGSPGWAPEEMALHAVHVRRTPALDSLCAGRVRQGCSHTSIILPRALVQAPIRGARRLAPAGKSSVDASVPQLPSDFVSSVRRLVESLLVTGDSRIEHAAESAGMSKRTFQRRLSESGETYREIVNGVRLELGARWLASTEKSVLEIALQLGYEEASNFTRAFRRRAGTSPRAYRSRFREDAKAGCGEG